MDVGTHLSYAHVMSDTLSIQSALGGIRNRQSIIDGVATDAKKWKPPGYDSEVSKRRDYYEGRQLLHTRAALARRYPKTWQYMQPYTVPIFAHMVGELSTMYRTEPRREWDGLSAQAAEKIYSDGAVTAQMQRIERIAAAARVCFVRVGWDEYEDTLSLVPYWPDSINVVCNPAYPTKLEAAYALTARIVGEEGVRLGPDTSTRYEIWTRVDGGWQRTVADSDGKKWTPNENDEQKIYPMLPWVAVHYDLPNQMFEMPGLDEMATSESIDGMYTDLLYTISMQAHTQLWYSGPKPEHDLVGGPGVIWNAGDGGQFGVINYTPQIDAVKNSAADLLGQLLILRGVSPALVKIDNPEYASGTSYKMQQHATIEQRALRVPYFRTVEERRLWPIIAEVARWHTGTDLSELSYRWQPGELEFPTDDRSNFELSRSYVNAGVSTWTREMVRLRLAPDLAVAQILRDDALDQRVETAESDAEIEAIKGEALDAEAYAVPHG
jgi:hypothetical protein